ncbi:PQQ-binding-like beta-propeller repeat protein [Robertkochia solimangrovi]|uniref:outer membrane protein assembly factor BamB family protein n=1 Tax=Robertkochia solimangrovi TaxID=2213046 RepID=UPI0011810132|nr:PQQ-binding-like beta-propeller repeat protein [Robertkochia solimangrovi]TRZ45281.1 pyrroloquinoline quinone-dependent dehydrogenase [Robertkochia solimangrovi]
MNLNRKIISIILIGTPIILWCYSCKEKLHENNSWTVYNADRENSKYSSLDLITSENVDSLHKIWEFTMDDLPKGKKSGMSQSNPIIIGKILYTLSANAVVYAIDITSGKRLWTFEGGAGSGVNRGVTYWEKKSDKRILFAGGNQLYALDAITGKSISSFGNQGKVDLRIGLRDDPDKMFMTVSTPGIIYKDLIILGNRLQDKKGAPPGYIRAYNCLTGKLEWTFHTIPLPGEPGNETWPEHAWKTSGGVNNWAGMSLDDELGIVYIPLGSPTYDNYGADRKGANLYGNSLLALDAATGSYKWHFQVVHHDLWDYDLPAAPNLVTVVRDGQEIPAVAQITKHGFIFIFDRKTGVSLYPIHERSVPSSNLPGEEAWPSQPFPEKPDPFVKQGIRETDLQNSTAISFDSLLQKFRSYRHEGLFTPPDLKGTLSLPGSLGGGEWGGAAYDKETGILYIRGNNAPELITLVRQPVKNDKNTPPDKLASEIYQWHCASCHGLQKQGVGTTTPALTGIHSRLSREEAKKRIENGSGIMPAFGNVFLEEELDALLDFVYDDRRVISETQSKEHEVATSGENLNFINKTAYRIWTDDKGNRTIKPPWGTLQALNVATGEYLWKVPVGSIDSLQTGTTATGLEGRPGPIVTAGGLIFISGGEDRKLQAYDKRSGEMLWEYPLPAIANATPSTYEWDEKQYVVISVGGTDVHPAGSIMVFGL